MSKPLFDDFGDADNPFTAPRAESPRGYAIGASEKEAIRYRYLGHEQYIRAVSLLFLCGGVACAGLGLVFLLMDPERALGLNAADADQYGIGIKVVAVIALIIAAINIYIGLGLRGYKSGARIVAIILNGITLLTNTAALFLGGSEKVAGGIFQTIIVGAILYVLLSAKSRAIFTPEYRSIVEETPYIRPKSGCLLIVAVFGVIFLAALGMAIFGVAARR